MKHYASNALLIAALVGGVLFLLRDEVFFLQAIDGRVIRSWQDVVANASNEGSPEITPMVELQTSAGVVALEVPLAVYNQARPGSTVHKRRFSNRVVVSR